MKQSLLLFSETEILHKKKVIFLQLQELPIPPSLLLCILGIMAQKRQNLAQKWHFWPNIGIFAHLVPCPTKKQCEQGALVVSRHECTKTFKLLFPPVQISIFGPNNSYIWPKICIYGHFGPNIGIFGPFGPMPDQYNNANKV